MPPKPGKIPSWSSGRPSFVPFVATRALHARATSSPPPRARPRTAATVGLAPDSSSSQKASLILLSMPPPPPDFANWLMSNPAEKALEPLPVTTMATAAGEAWARRRQSKRAVRTGKVDVFLLRRS